MISQAAEYALRAVVCLAHHHPLPQTTRQIADHARIPPSYLAKVLQALVRRNIVVSQRGLRGGFLLAAAAEQITMLDVVLAVDSSRRIATCPLGIPSHGTSLCSLHRRLDAAAAHVEEILRESNVAELICDSSCRPLMCDHACAKGTAP